MSVYLRPGSPYYQYEFELDGVRFRGSTRTTEKRKARQVEADARIAARAPKPPAAPDPLTINTAFARYWIEHAQFGRGARVTMSKLAVLRAGLGAETLLPEIGGRLADYARERRATVKPATINGDFTILRAVLNRARRIWKVPVGDEIVWTDHWLPEGPKRRRYSSTTEDAGIRDGFHQARPELVGAHRLSLISGLRKINIVKLSWPEIDREQRELTTIVKGNRMLTIPLTDEAMEIIERERGHHPHFVFTYINRRPSRRKGPKKGARVPLTVSVLRDAWRDAKKIAGVTDLHWHDNRHTAGTRLLRATGNLPLVRDMLGHASVQSTERYAHVLTEDLRRGMEAAFAPSTPQNPPQAAECQPKPMIQMRKIG